MAKALAGKIALVTGGARGIGRAIAVRLAASGALVAINYAVNESAARETLALIEASGGRGFVLQAKLGECDAAEALAAALREELTGRTGASELDILVNNVGGGPAANIETTTREIYEDTFASNVGATLWVTKSLLPSLRQGGRIVNISSAASRIALEDLLVYSMSKAAVDNFTRAMAKYLGPRGITVNSVLPGSTETDAAEGLLSNPVVVNYMAANTALQRAFGRPEEIADVVHALASPALGWVTGQCIEASGGFRL